jgi:hypothetical protein
MNRMEATSNTDVFQRMWQLYATGRTREILDYIDPEVEWRPAVLEPAVYHGHAGLRTWASDARRAWKSITVIYDDMREPADGCVVSEGRIAVFDRNGQLVIDGPLACVAQFQDGLVMRAGAFVSLDEAMGWVMARPELS